MRRTVLAAALALVLAGSTVASASPRHQHPAAAVSAEHGPTFVQVLVGAWQGLVARWTAATTGTPAGGDPQSLDPGGLIDPNGQPLDPGGLIDPSG
jgi:hypothetical protein